MYNFEINIERYIFNYLQNKIVRLKNEKKKKKELIFKSLYVMNLHTNPNLTNKTKFKENKMKRKEAM